MIIASTLISKETNPQVKLFTRINKKSIKIWLQYLVNTPLYDYYNITITHGFLSDDDEETQQIGNIDEVTEDIPIEESITAQQHIFLWNDEKYLRTHLGKTIFLVVYYLMNTRKSFPTIYLGQFRTFKEDIRATSFMMASSELRRTDRRAITPYHLVYTAVKIMRLRIRDSLTVAFKHIGPNTNITRDQIQSDEYISNCIESNLVFLCSIPNSS
ncbi:unnamed protein product [Parnassius apollo]|uniref:(apollo) hypothetical protein n=1 Tax=Parnassius apollo TaxID=110799 RepID=A0A8S3WQQ7_PARAO|nr:unnamed protein product [Parnassius apollo]